MLRELETVVIPQWALVAIVNDDYSGLSDEDEALIEAWLEAKAKKHGSLYASDIHIEASDYTNFYYANDLTDVGDDCVEVRLFAHGLQPRTED